MCAKQVKKAENQVSTTGHSWDGIEEYNNPLPRWWVWVFYLTIIWGIGYTIAYPAWPMLSGATPGVIGSDQRADVRAEIERFNKQNEAIQQELVAYDLLSTAPMPPELKAYAENQGAAVFKNNCAQCHGAGAAGVQGKGYPNLVDNDWLWGGTVDDIHTTVLHGIRNSTDADARYSEMPKFGADELLTPEQIGQVVEHVLQLSGQDHDAAAATEGATIFADNCAACHGPEGTGDRAQGAPNLADAIWLYGGDRATLTETVTNARFGVMPGWTGKLTEEEMRAVALYVHSRGGGE